ncbi:unnamed protein product, partial [Rotaria magnacalcarata]
MNDEQIALMFKSLTDAVTQLTASNAKQEAQINSQSEIINALKNKGKKVPEPEPYDLNSGVTLPEFFIHFEGYCTDLYGDAKKDAWSPVLKKFLEGAVKEAYIGLKGGNLAWDLLKDTLIKQFADNVQRTKNFKIQFNALKKEESESLLAFSIRVTHICECAHPHYGSEELADMTKSKFLEKLPCEIAEKMAIIMVDTDLAAYEYSKLVTLAERFEMLCAKIVIVEAATKVEIKASEPNTTSDVQAVVSLRPNGGALPKVVCTHCNKGGHTHDKCWTLHTNLKPVRNNNNNNQNRGNNYRGNSNNNRGAQNNNNQNNNGRKCYSCGIYGHFANACPNRQYNPNIPQQQYVNIPNQYQNMSNQNRPQNAAVFNTNRECNICHAQGQNFHVWQQCPMAEINVTGIGGSAKVHGKINLELNIGKNIKVCHPFVIVDELANELLIGADFIRKNKFIIDISNNKLLKNSNNVEVKTNFQVNATNNVIKPKAVLINKKDLDQTIDTSKLNSEVRLTETFNLKPHHSTVIQCKLNDNFKNTVNVFSVGIFPDNVTINNNLMIQSSVVNSNVDRILMPIINCSDEIVQLKQGTIVAYAQKLVVKGNGELAEAGFEWIKREVNTNQYKKSESFMEMFRMSEANLTKEENKRIEILLNKYAKCISLNDNDVGKTSTIKHNIELVRDVAIKQPIRRVNGELAERIEKTLEQDHKDGIIRPSNSPWSSCIVPIVKKCGGLRLAVDYRILNSLTVKDSFPLPNLNDAVYNLHGSKYFSTLDLTRGYYNVPMDEQSIPLTAFSTSRSHWEFVRMPFGLCNAGATFQRLMNMVLRGFSWSECICYIDDALILGSTFEEHFKNLNNVLECLSQHGLKIKPAKCFLFRKEVKFLGYEVSQKGIMPDKKNIEGITNFPIPKTVKQVRSFLGIVNFYRLHIPNCATIQKPLSELTGKAKTLVWNDKAENAFNQLKKLLTSPQLLAYPNYESSEPLEIHVDSSLTGAGAILSQKQSGVVRPIAFISTSWGISEQDYASTARELAGLRWAVKKLAPFLRGRKFIVHTDNQPLVYLSNTKCISSRLARTLEDLSDFDFEVKWIPGQSNIVADALSRMHESILDSSRAKETLNVLGDSLKEIKMEGGGDSLIHCLSYFLTGNISDSLKLRQQIVSELIAHPKLYGLD